MSSQAPTPLSERERELMELVATGASNSEIALKMGISPNTVKVHLRNIFEKIGAASRTEASVIALREGWVMVDGMTAPSGEAEGDAEIPALVVADADDAVEATAPVEVTMTPSVRSDPAVPAAVEQPAVDERLVTTIADPRPSPLPAFSPWLIGLSGLLALLLLIFTLPRWRTPSPPAPPSGAPTIALPERWTVGEALPAPRTAALAATVGRDLYVLGGEDENGPARDLWRLREGAAWEVLAPLPVALRGAALDSVGGSLYVAGGEDAGRAPQDGVWRYDSADGTWHEMEDALPVALTDAAMASFEGDLYLFGGTGEAGTSTAIYRLLDGEGPWEEAGDLPAPRRALAAVAQPEGIILLGGVDETGKPVATSYLFDPRAAEALTELPDLPTPAAAPRAVGISGGLYLLEGTRLYERDPQGAWRQLDAPPEGIPARAALLAQDPYLMLVGGGDTTAPRSEVLRYEALYRTLFPIVPGK